MWKLLAPGVRLVDFLTPDYVIKFVSDLQQVGALIQVIQVSSTNKNEPPLYNWNIVQAKKKYVCLRSPDPPYFSAADPNLFYRQLFHPNFYTEFG